VSGWISGGEHDTYALVADASERDAYLRSGDWVTAGEPGDGDWVHIWHEGSAVPGRYPMSALRELWGPRGYVAGPPPDGTSPFAPKPAAEPVAKPKPSKPAAGGDTEE
jgi:hypothetical protein